jgi:hypothetical protein
MNNNKNPNSKKRKVGEISNTNREDEKILFGYVFLMILDIFIVKVMVIEMIETIMPTTEISMMMKQWLMMMKSLQTSRKALMKEKEKI